METSNPARRFPVFESGSLSCRWRVRGGVSESALDAYPGGYAVNPKRVLRMNREEQLFVRRRKRKSMKRVPRKPLQAATGINERWSMDFVSDSYGPGRSFRVLNVLDDAFREAVIQEARGTIRGKVSPLRSTGLPVNKVSRQ